MFDTFSGEKAGHITEKAGYVAVISLMWRRRMVRLYSASVKMLAAFQTKLQQGTVL